MKTAEEFLTEVKEEPTYNVYCYYDKLLKRYNQPYITTDNPNLMIEQAKASVLKEVKNQIKFKDLILVYLGKFNIITGKFDCGEDVALVDFDRYIVTEESADGGKL